MHPAFSVKKIVDLIITDPPLPATARNCYFDAGRTTLHIQSVQDLLVIDPMPPPLPVDQRPIQYLSMMQYPEMEQPAAVS